MRPVRRLALAAAAMLCVGALDAAPAAAQQRARAAARQQPPVAAERPQTSGAARMIEVEPGVFVSTFECTADDGRGRRRPCSGAGGGGSGGAGGGGGM